MKRQAPPTNRGAPLVLASTSPRRRTILEQLRVPFELASPTYEETALPGHSPRELIAAHALAKARSVHAAHPGRSILAVDTGVVLGQVLFGKPKDADDAARILSSLAGKTHTVVSGLCLLDGEAEATGLSESSVTFRDLSSAQISRYVGTEEWKGLAGGYAIQGFGAPLVESVAGDYLNIVGLPASLLIDTLAEHRPDLLAIGV